MSSTARSVSTRTRAARTCAVACVALVVSRIEPTVTLVQPDVAAVESPASPSRTASVFTVAARVCLPSSVCFEGWVTIRLPDGRTVGW